MSHHLDNLASIIKVHGLRGLGRRARAYQRGINLALLPTIILSSGFVSLAVLGLDAYHATRQVIITSACLAPLVGFMTNYGTEHQLVRYGLGLQKTVRVFLDIALLIAIVLFLLKYGQEVSRLALALTFAISLAVACGLRIAMIWFTRRTVGTLAERILVIEDRRYLEIAFPNSIRLCGFNIKEARHDPAMLDALGRLLCPVDRVIISCNTDRERQWRDLLSAFNVRVDLVDERATSLGALEIGEFAGHRTFMLAGYPLSMRSRALKRACDILLSFLGLAFTLPILIVVCCLIFVEDGRPLFFRQKRVGRDNLSFEMYKFRSMSSHCCDVGATALTVRGDPRVTRVGRFIRATSIDELPQLLNVLKGDMSLVGPRPHAPMARAGAKLYWEIDPRYWHRHRLRPGLSGLAQIRGFRGNTEEERHLSNRLESDLQYIEGWSIWRDLRIILATARVLVHSRAF